MPGRGDTGCGVGICLWPQKYIRRTLMGYPNCANGAMCGIVVMTAEECLVIRRQYSFRVLVYVNVPR